MMFFFWFIFSVPDIFTTDTGIDGWGRGVWLYLQRTGMCLEIRWATSWHNLLITQFHPFLCCLQPRLVYYNWAPSSEFVSSSIPSWQISTAHAQPFSWARDLAFCLKIPLDSLLVWASSEGSGETAQMRRLAWTFAARIGDKYQIRLTRSNYKFKPILELVRGFRGSAGCIKYLWDTVPN